MPRDSIRGYIPHAREGSELMGITIDIYQRVNSLGRLTDETEPHLIELFHRPANYIPNSGGNTVSTLLRERASIVLENWIPVWAT